MEQLVELSPFQFPGDDSRMFVGRRETALISLDLESGDILNMISSDNNCPWKAPETHTSLEDVQIDLDELDGTKPPRRPRRRREVVIGRTGTRPLPIIAEAWSLTSLARLLCHRPCQRQPWLAPPANPGLLCVRA